MAPCHPYQCSRDLRGFYPSELEQEVAEVKELLKGKNLSSEIEAERKEERKHFPSLYAVL